MRAHSTTAALHQGVPSSLWKLGRLNHIAIAVPDMEKATALYRDVLGATVSDKVPLPEHGVYTVFVELGNTKLELLYPLGEKSPIAGFLQKNKSGGMHHICIEVRQPSCLVMSRSFCVGVILMWATLILDELQQDSPAAETMCHMCSCTYVTVLEFFYHQYRHKVQCLFQYHCKINE